MGSSLSYPEVDLSGRTAIVTGANTGIGYETAKALARMGCKVVVACRSKERAETAIERMRGELPDQTLDLVYRSLDLGSLSSVHSFAKEFVEENEKLDLLVLNAGIAMVPFGKTTDGYERHFQVNYLGHLLLAFWCIPLLQRVHDPRLIFVSSAGHKFGKLNLQNVNGEKEYRPFDFYCHSKFYQVLAAFKLSHILSDSKLSISSLHPGQVSTELQRDFEGFWKGYTKVANAFGAMRTPVEGAATSIFAAVSPNLEGQKGLFLESCKVTRASSASYNEATQDRLWSYSLGLLREYMTDEQAATLKIDWQTISSQQQMNAQDETNNCKDEGTGESAAGLSVTLKDDRVSEKERLPSATEPISPGLSVAGDSYQPGSE